MAIRFPLHSLPSTIFPTTFRCSSSINGRRLVMMCANNKIAINLHIRSSDHKIIKVFEDRSAGIVCYKDENGEITCEGYDEGPRFYQPFPICNNTFRRGDEEIIELLQRCLVQVSDEDEVKNDAADIDIHRC